MDITAREITSIKVESTWNRRGFFDHWFFDQQNYIKKVDGNDVEIRQNLVFDAST